MNGRRKGLDGEREAVALLRAEGLRVVRVASDRDSRDDIDVDAVILPPGESPAVLVQIKREERAPIAWFGFLGRHRAVMCRRNGEAWSVWIAALPADLGDPPLELTPERFARWCLGGMV